jgi:hypothetical protein
MHGYIDAFKHGCTHSFTTVCMIVHVLYMTITYQYISHFVKCSRFPTVFYVKVISRIKFKNGMLRCYMKVFVQLTGLVQYHRI